VYRTDHSRPSIRLGDPGIDQAWLRRHRQGAWTALAWLFGWMAIVCVGVVTKAGVFGWMASLELRLLGSDNPIITALPALAIWLGPGVVVTWMKKDVARPFLFGIQDALDTKRQPVLMLAPDAVPRRLRNMLRASLAIAALCLIPVAIGIWKIEHVGANPPTPLPVVDYARVVSGAALPGHARIEGVTAFAGHAWIHDYSIRQDHHRDAYYPLAPAGWTPDQPVQLLERDSTYPGDKAAPSNQVDAPGPREGALHPLDDDWIKGELQRSGFKLAEPVMLLDRAPLHGIEPSPDTFDLFLDYVFPALIAAVIALGLAAATRLQIRRLPSPENRSGP
jgi:hypothetical protein